MVGSDRARLSLLVAAIADRVGLVGRSKSATVQEIFGRVLSRCRNHCSSFHLGAATVAITCLRTARLSPTRHRGDRELLLLQLAHDRALLVADRRRGLAAKKCGGRRPPLQNPGSIVDLRRGSCYCFHLAAQCTANLQRIQTGRRMVASFGTHLRAGGIFSNRKWLRVVSRDDERSKRNRDR